MRAVVIGGTGFIGSPTVRQLVAGGHEVISVQRRQSPSVEGVRQIQCEQQNLASRADELRRLGADVVIDFVSSSAAQARATVETFEGHVKRTVAISSQDVYRVFGIVNGIESGPLEVPPVTEDSPRRTSRNTYPPEVLSYLKTRFGWVTDDYNNAEMEDVVTAISGTEWTVLRLPMVYGPGDYLHRLYPILKRIDDGRRVIPIVDNVVNWRSPRGYVEDVAHAVVIAAGHPAAARRVYNVAEQQSFSEAEWARLVAEAAGCECDVVTIPLERAPQHLHMPGNYEQDASVSTRRIREELGFREITPRDTALQRTIAWERANPPDPIPSFDYEAEDRALGELNLRAS